MTEQNITSLSKINQEEIPYSYCHCGCGGKAPIATRNRYGYKKGDYKKFISGHNTNGNLNPNWRGGRNNVGDYIKVFIPKNIRDDNRQYKREHILLVESILGYKLPQKAVVHHVDGNPRNNNKDNLVVCENSAYHSFLHRRLRAYQACGHANWRKCKRCKKYDKPELIVNEQHKECHNEYEKQRYYRTMRLDKQKHNE